MRESVIADQMCMLCISIGGIIGLNIVGGSCGSKESHEQKYLQDL